MKSISIEKERESMLCEAPAIDKRGHWMTTFTGRMFYPFDPQIVDMDIMDVGHHLGMQCRYNGACHYFYSVAEHCVLGSYLVPREHAFDFLMHDVAETWTGDLIRPLKHGTSMGVGFGELESNITFVAGIKWDFRSDVSCVKQIDREMIIVEQRNLFPNFPQRDLLDFKVHPKVKLGCWPPLQAKEMFLKRFIELQGERGGE